MASGPAELTMLKTRVVYPDITSLLRAPKKWDEMARRAGVGVRSARRSQQVVTGGQLWDRWRSGRVEIAATREESGSVAGPTPELPCRPDKLPVLCLIVSAGQAVSSAGCCTAAVS